jgi:hypothetical protein
MLLYPQSLIPEKQYLGSRQPCGSELTSLPGFGSQSSGAVPAQWPLSTIRAPFFLDSERVHVLENALVRNKPYTLSIGIVF